MFLPSEAIYAELHANFVDVVETSYKAKVWIVSPTTLMATLNTVRAILKDAYMREQAGVIQKEVGLLIEDICRLDERIENLGRHFKQANDDIDSIKISSSKISKRIEKIEAIEVGKNNQSSISYIATTTSPALTAYRFPSKSAKPSPSLQYCTSKFSCQLAGMVECAAVL